MLLAVASFAGLYPALVVVLVFFIRPPYEGVDALSCPESAFLPVEVVVPASWECVGLLNRVIPRAAVPLIVFLSVGTIPGRSPLVLGP